MIRYRIFEEIRGSEAGEYLSYGIAAFTSCGELICFTPDITPNRCKAITLAEKCEKLCLSPIHLTDVAEDYIISDNC